MQNCTKGKASNLFIICALISFLIKRLNSDKLMIWKSVHKKIYSKIAKWGEKIAADKLHL